MASLDGLHLHPDRSLEKGIKVSTGSLGQGFPIALGMAIADPKRNIYCMISDGECAEGSIWESLRILVDQKVKNSEVFVARIALAEHTSKMADDVVAIMVEVARTGTEGDGAGAGTGSRSATQCEFAGLNEGAARIRVARIQGQRTATGLGEDASRATEDAGIGGCGVIGAYVECYGVRPGVRQSQSAGPA